MGSLFKPKVPDMPAPPADNTVYNFQDNVSGTKGTRVQNADGSYTMVYERLPLSADEQAYQDKLKQIETDSLGWIQKIAADPNYQSDYVKQAVENYKLTTTRAVNDAFTARTGAEEQNLARYGVEDSSAANALRAQRGRDMSASLEQVGRDVNEFSRTARQDDLNQATNLYTLASGRGDVQLNQALQGLSQGQGAALSLSQLQQNRQMDLWNAQNQYNAMRANASNIGRQTVGQIVGTGLAVAAPYVAGAGASAGLFGGYDPRRGVTWNSGRRI